MENLACPEGVESATEYYDPAGTKGGTGEDGRPLCAGCGMPRSDHIKPPLWEEITTRMWSDDRSKQSIYAEAWQCGYCYGAWIRASMPAKDDECPRCSMTEGKYKAWWDEEDEPKKDKELQNNGPEKSETL